MADDGYVPKAVLALRSFQKKHPECGYFLFANAAKLRSETINYIHRNGIELVDVEEDRRFINRGTRAGIYPPEVFYLFEVPERLADRGFSHSLVVDGDVFCHRRLDLTVLLPQVSEVAVRPVKLLAHTLHDKQAERNFEYNFDKNQVCRDLGLSAQIFDTRYEYNTGVVLWNNSAMKTLGLLEKCRAVFERCHCCFEGDQDLFAFTAAVNDFRVLHLDDRFNFAFFCDSLTTDWRLAWRISLGKYDDIRLVHYVFLKPWEHHVALRPVEAHFVNLWREHARDEPRHECIRNLQCLSPVHSMRFFDRVVRGIRGRLSDFT